MDAEAVMQLKMDLGWVFLIRGYAGSYFIIGWIVLYRQMDCIISSSVLYCIVDWIVSYWLDWIVSYWLDYIRKHWF